MTKFRTPRSPAAEQGARDAFGARGDGAQESRKKNPCWCWCARGNRIFNFVCDAFRAMSSSTPPVLVSVTNPSAGTLGTLGDSKQVTHEISTQQQRARDVDLQLLRVSIGGLRTVSRYPSASRVKARRGFESSSSNKSNHHRRGLHGGEVQRS